MASALCRSKSLTNLFVHQVITLDITELRGPDVNRNNQWVYVIGVTWSDMRETKIFRSYSEVSDLYIISNKQRQNDKSLRMRKCTEIPKVPGRGFFDWNLIKLMIRNQHKIDYFLKILITLPPEISRHQQVLDFFEERTSDKQLINERTMKSNSTSEPPEASGAISSPIDFNGNQTTPVGSQTSAVDAESDDVEQMHQIPDYLPVTSCFEPDDVTMNEANDYQTLLEDITSFDLFEDYETIYSFPLKNLARLKQNLHNDSSSKELLPFYDQDWWLKECEEILSPYSLKKEYFRLVQDFEICY